MYVSNVDENFILELKNVAIKSKCKRSKCGSIIVYNNKQIGLGWNSMPCDILGECFKDSLSPEFKSDKTCCVHAEQRAIIDALSNGFEKELKESTLFFLRLDEKDNPKYSGDPYCSICSKLALDVGIKNFALYRKNGWNIYNTEEYNKITFKY